MAKVKKENNVIMQGEITGADTVGTIMEYMITLICGLLFVLLPLYMGNGYVQIGAMKYNLYRVLGVYGMGLMSALGMLYLILARKRICVAWLKKNCSVLDRMMLLYLICVLISFALCDEKAYAVWGYEGWCMGLLSQLSFIALYFITSRFCADGKVLLIVLCSTSVIVFALGIMNRFLIDPLGVYEGLSDWDILHFLSTLGQSSWYSSFLCSVLPMGLYFYWSASRRMVQWISGLYCMIGFGTLVTQNSDSAYVALMCMLMVLFWFSVKDEELLFRFFTITLLFLASTRIIHFFTLFGNTSVIDRLDTLSLFVIKSPVMWVLIVLNATGLAVLWRLRKKQGYRIKNMVIVRNIVYGIALLGLVLGILCLWLSGTKRLPESLSLITRRIPYLTWSDKWGNKRGFTWRMTWNMFSEMSVKDKLIGLGPEGYPLYISRYKEEVDVMFAGLVLPNAHNEWYNAMINYGILGAVSYLGVFVAAVMRFAKYNQLPLLVGIMTCAVSYIGHNFFCYQQVLCTPFIMCMIGLGEYRIRQEERGEYDTKNEIG